MNFIITINVLEVLLWLIGTVFIWKVLLPKEYKEEIGTLNGIAIEIVYTIAYCFFAHYYDVQIVASTL